jgi:predicted HicB family RNase H-like nuclease
MDTVLFEGETVKELETNFKEAVNHYIETCKKAGKEPQKAFKGGKSFRNHFSYRHDGQGRDE